MEPENILQETKPKNVLFVVTPLSKYLALVLFILMPFIGGWIGYQYGSSNSSEKIIDQKTEINTPAVKTELDGEILTEPQLYTSNQKNISFTIPAGWKEIHSTKITLQQGAKEPFFIIENPSTRCVIASGGFEWDMTSYRQISFADRIFSPVFQFDGNWVTGVSAWHH